MTITIRPETSADEAAIREVNVQAFGRNDEARLVDAVRRSPGSIPALSLVAEEDGTIVGHALFSKVLLEEDDAPRELLALGPIAVRPERQRQGIGGQLIQAGLARTAEAGWPAVVLIGHPAYYPRFGFRPGSAFGLTCEFSVPDDVFMALPLQPGGLNRLRGRIVYPPPFHDL